MKRLLLCIIIGVIVFTANSQTVKQPSLQSKYIPFTELGYACKGHDVGVHFAFVYAGDWSLGKSNSSSIAAIIRDDRRSSYTVSIKDASELILELKKDGVDLLYEFATDPEIAKSLLENYGSGTAIECKKIELNATLNGVPTDRAAYIQYSSTTTKPGVTITIDGWAYLFFLNEKLVILNLLAMQSDDKMVKIGYSALHKAMSDSFIVANSSDEIDTKIDKAIALFDQLKSTR